MFRDSNIFLFLLCLLPVIFYSIIIIWHSPSFSIRLKTSFIHLFIGLLSVTVLQFIFFIFPHIQDIFFKVHVGNFNMEQGHFEVFQQTIYSLLLFAFVQVALAEETSKWIAFKCADYMRGKRRKNLDHPYAIMFYSSLISAGFAIVENVQYAQRAIIGEFGHISPKDVLIIRAVTSVIIHMACGLFMGYYIAKGRKSSFTKKILYNIIGILSAVFIHGIYDLNWMKPGFERDYYDVPHLFLIHISSAIIIFFSICIAFFMSWDLKHHKHSQIKQ